MIRGISISVLFFLLFFSVETRSQEQLACIEPKIIACIESKISEVYKGHEHLFNNNPTRLNALKDLLDNRIEIISIPFTEDEKTPKLSEIPLFNKYNKDLVRDSIYNPSNFNVLKYDLEFFTIYSKMYRIDSTDLMIFIHPISKK